MCNDHTDAEIARREEMGELSPTQDRDVIRKTGGGDSILNDIDELIP